MSTISQVTQPRVERDLVITTTCDPSKTITVTIERFDGNYYDPSDGQFKALGSITSPYLALTENPPASGNYSTTLNVAGWTDGNYNTRLYDSSISPTSPTLLDGPDTIYVDGGSGAPTGSTLTKVDHNYGGADAMRYETASGDPVDGAFVYAVLASSYDASAPTLQALAITTTDSEGRWNAPFFLDPGTYVIICYKPNNYGPNTETINVV